MESIIRRLLDQSCKNMQYTKLRSYFSTRRYNGRISCFTLGLAVGTPAKFIAARAWSGCKRDILVNARLACCEKRRNDVYLPSLLYAVTLSRVSRAERSRSGRSVSRTDTRVHSPWREAVKQNECIRKASDFSSSTKEELTVRTIEVQTRG